MGRKIQSPLSHLCKGRFDAGICSAFGIEVTWDVSKKCAAGCCRAWRSSILMAFQSWNQKQIYRSTTRAPWPPSRSSALCMPGSGRTPCIRRAAPSPDAANPDVLPSSHAGSHEHDPSGDLEMNQVSASSYATASAHFRMITDVVLRWV